MSKKTTLLILSIILCLFFVTSFSRSNSKVSLLLNQSNNDEIPKEFRTSSDPFKRKSDEKINTEGLSTLRISGSAQFSEKGLKKIIKRIPAKKITFVDLRMESHGFLNGHAISWYKKNNWANLGLTTKEIQQNEKEHLTQLKAKKDLRRIGFTLLTTPEITSEEELVKSYGHDYIRIYVPDHHHPSDEQVTQFLNILRTLPQDSWLHFHCQAGIGRTTTFMILYDMFYNASRISFDQILMRQHLIGGKNFLKPLNKNHQFYPYFKRRFEFLKKFYLTSRDRNK